MTRQDFVVLGDFGNTLYWLDLLDLIRTKTPQYKADAYYIAFLAEDCRYD